MVDDNNEADDGRSLRVLLKNLMGNTSSHGLPNIDRAANPFRRFFWSVLFTWALGMFLWQSYELIYAYFQWDVDVNIDIQYKTEIDFPAVTFCNLNPVKASPLENSRKLELLLGPPASGTSSVASTVSASSDPSVSEAPGKPPGSSTAEAMVGSTTSSLAKESPMTGTEASAVISDQPTTGANSGGEELTTVPTDSGLSKNPEGQDTMITGNSATSPTGLGPTAGIGEASGGATAPSGGGAQGKGAGRRKRQTSEASDKRYQDWDNLDYTDRDDDMDLFDQVADAIAQTEYDDRRLFGHSVDDMLLACSYKGYPCGPKNFTLFHNYLYGNCYTFNSGMDGDIQTSSKSGPLYGLVLELNLEETEYLTSMQQAAGVRVVIGEQYHMPFPEDAGINVAPGLLTSIGIRKVEIQRKGDPYTNCTDEDTEDTETVFSSFFGANYSLEACQKNCLYETIFETCGCADTRFHFSTDRVPCLSTNISQITCKEGVERLYAEDEIECNCTSPCLESDFELTVSSAAWPNSQYAETVLENLMEISDDLRTKVGNDASFVQDLG
ncbi:amiloride-sensitive sodium channel subunit gamma-like isoform X2 [Patiria miniata]|uniref:Uncharacterized protein n=1 Tax=Patiria miniata TaxID=46514 RepID=A0A914BCS1_PATMI|nr:amiloride-sensitive sodium channel subunit gamma-like isoform X2 [Patiria miniata]